MNRISEYLNFIKEKGRPLSEINLSSDEVALMVSDALQALELLKDSQTIILGGDILSEDANNKLGYAIRLWDYDYHYLNWYYDKAEDKSGADYLQRSYEVAKAGIANANEVAERLKKKCLIVFVI